MKIRKQADKWPHARESELGNRGNFCSWNPESWRSGIRNSAQGRGNLAHDCNPKSKFHWQRIWNPECTSYNPESKTVVDSLTGYDFFGEGKGGWGLPHRGQTSEHARRIAWGSLRSIWKSYTHVATSSCGQELGNFVCISRKFTGDE